MKPVTNHDGGRPWITTHGSDERGQDAEGALWRQHQGSESVRAKITEKPKDERGSAQAVARCAYALQMHEVDRGRPQQHDHSGMSLEKDHVQTRASSRCSATHGEDACGGESWPNDQGKEQSWTEQRDVGPRIEVVSELLKKKKEPWWNDRGSDAAWESSRGGDIAACYCKNVEMAGSKELHQNDTHHRKRLSWSRAYNCAKWLRTILMPGISNKQWEGVVTPSPTPHPTESSPTQSPTPSTTCAFSTVSGQCTVECDCISSPNYLGDYNASDHCVICVEQGTAQHVLEFLTEQDYDLLWVNGQSYSYIPARGAHERYVVAARVRAGSLESSEPFELSADGQRSRVDPHGTMFVDENGATLRGWIDSEDLKLWGPDARVQLAVGNAKVNIEQHTEDRGETCLASRTWLTPSAAGWAWTVPRTQVNLQLGVREHTVLVEDRPRYSINQMDQGSAEWTMLSSKI